MRTAIFGMPATLTPLEALYLDLCSEVGRAIQTHTAVEAATIAAGRPGPWEYYLMLAGGNSRAAANMQSRAILRGMMNAGS